MGRDYETIVRYNSQSGKGGAAFLLEQNYGLFAQNDARRIRQDDERVADEQGREIALSEIFELFEREYLQKSAPFELESFRSSEREKGVKIAARVRKNGESY